MLTELATICGAPLADRQLDCFAEYMGEMNMAGDKRR